MPIARQRIRAAVAGFTAGSRLSLDGRDLGPAEAGPLVLAGPGPHRALFTMR